MNRILSLLVLCVLLSEVALCAVAPRLRQDDVIYLGFLDDHREEMVNWKKGVASQRVIRPAFEKTSSGWKTLSASSLPRSMKWTVAFDGRSLGEIEGRGTSYGLTAFQAIMTPATAVPTVGSPSDEFAGIMGMGGQTKIRRPLVVVSKPYFRDPDGWKRTKLSDETGILVREAFRREYPHVNRCKDEEIVEKKLEIPRLGPGPSRSVRVQ